MSHPNARRLSHYDDPAEDEREQAAIALQLANAGIPPPGHVGSMPPHGHGPPPPGVMPPPGHLPPHHPSLMGGGQHPQHGGFFNPQAFNSGLAAAIAAAEFQKQREAAATAHIFAAAHANGVQPFIPGFPPGQPPPHAHAPPPTAHAPPPPHMRMLHQPHPPPHAHLPPETFAPGMSPPPQQKHPQPIHSPPAAAPSPSASPSNSTTSTPPAGTSSSGGGSGSGAAAGPLQKRQPSFSGGRPELPPQKFSNSCVPLGVPEDKFYLSELQCVLRSEFVEAFGTTQTDIVQSLHGRSKPISLGQVGIRCQHCKDANLNQENTRSMQNSVSYPSFISGIYNVVQQMYRLHFDQCKHIPEELKERVASLKDSHTSNRGGRKQYWMESAKRRGLVDTSFGIQFGRDPLEDVPPLGGTKRRTSITSTSVGGEEDEYHEFERTMSRGSTGSPDGEGSHTGPAVPVDDIEIYPLVLPEDKPLISDYLYLALEQMQPCNLMDADRVGCYKARRTGFPGLACKHCIGQAGCGRYFPASEASLSQTTTSQTIVNHVRNCRRCPLDTREQLELMKRAKNLPEYKKYDKPKHGGRKVFFRRLWCRIQRIPLPKSDRSAMSDMGSPSSSPPKEKSSSSRGSPEKKKRKRSADLSEKHSRNNEVDSDSDAEDQRDGEMETVEFDNVHNEGKDPASPSHARSTASALLTATSVENSHVVYQGRTRLSRGDDLHWLSEADCFIRHTLTEVFTAPEEDSVAELGQVGIRCFYCAENKPAEERNRGHVYFPNSVGAIQQAVSDLQRRHLGICSEIPEDIREKFRSMKGYVAKPKGDTAQYWVDSARELGLHDSHDGQGISFFRNPMENSPADELDIAKNDDSGSAGTILVPAEDQQKCTDHMLLLLNQFEPCQFRGTDRKSSRSRDRALGFPGLVCIHCKQKRYFPITEKKLQDSLGLMTTHINNCFHAPLDVKASLGYLYHRSLLQRQELAGQWKSTFFKGVWNRLYQHLGIELAPAASMDTTEDVPVSQTDSLQPERNEDTLKALPEEDDFPPVEDNSAMEEENSPMDDVADNVPDVTEAQGTQHHALLHDYHGEEEYQDNTDALKEMKGLIKAAALWLTERDEEYEARACSGRAKGIKRRP